MFTKIDIRSIVREHFDSLRDFSTGRPSLGDYFIFFGIPLLVALFSAATKYDLSDEARSALVNASAIFLGLLLNLLVLMFDQQNKNSDRIKIATAEPKDDALAKKLELFRTVIDQTISNISFTTLLSIFALLLLIIHSLLLTKAGNSLPLVTPAISAAALGLWLCILLTSMMILKRVFSLLINDKNAR